MKHLTKLLALLLPLLLLTGCWRQDVQPDDGLLPDASSSSEEAPEPAALPQALCLSYYPNQTLDPITCPDGPQQTVGTLLYEGLFQLDSAFSPQPLLCASYTYDPEALTYTFYLRSGIRFSDSSDLTAADAAATLNRARTSQRYSSRLADVTAVSVSEGAVVVRLSAANTGFPALLDIPIVKAGTERQNVPVGTGPYCFVAEENGAYLTANSLWWQGSVQPTQYVGLLAAQDADSLLYQFTSHETQLICADLTGSTPVSVTGSIDFQDTETTVFQYVGINTRSPLLSGAAVRVALSQGFDRQQIVSAQLSGHGTAAQFPVSPFSAEYPSALDISYSYGGFESAMTSAGCNTGSAVHHLTMLVNEENSFKVSAARSIAASLSAFDLKIEVRTLPWEEYTAALAAGDFDLYYAEVKLTADWDLRRLLSTGGSLNYGGYSSTIMDQLLSSYSTAQDRADAMAAVCRWIKKDAPILPVCFKTVSVLVQSGVMELTPTASNPFFGLSELELHLGS